MPLRFIHKYRFLFVVLGMVPGLNAQIKQSLLKNELSFSAGPVQGRLLNQNISDDPFAISTGAIQYNAGFNYSMYFSKYLRLVSGFGLSQFKVTTSYRGAYLSEELKRDATGTFYNPYAEASYKDLRILKTIDVPFCLRIITREVNNFEWYAQAGVQLNLVYGYSFTRTGYSKLMGSYPSIYNGITTISSNDPASGFVTTEYSGKSRDVEGSFFQLSALGCLGVRTRTSENYYFMAEFMLMRGFTDAGSGFTGYYENALGQKMGIEPFYLYSYGIRLGVALKLY